MLFAAITICLILSASGQTIPPPNMPPVPVANAPGPQSYSSSSSFVTPTPSSAVTEEPEPPVVFTLPIMSRQKPVAHAEEDTNNEVMSMVYPAVAGSQANKYDSLTLMGNTVEYYITISVGSPAQIFTLQLDTGSAITALPAGYCEDCYHYNSLYNSSTSTTSTVLSCADSRCSSGVCNDDGTCAFKVSYGDSSFISGNLISDVMGLPAAYKINNNGRGSGPTAESITTTLFSNTPIIFGAITDQSSGFQTHGVDGIMGLVFGGSKLSCVPNCASLVMDSIVNTHNIPNIFSIALHPITNNSVYNQEGGSITIGGIDAAFLGSNTVFYTDVIEEPYYTVLLGDISIGGVSIGADSSEFGSTIVDSGTTYTFVPPVVYNLLQSTMQTHYCHLPFVCGANSIFSNSSCVNSTKIDLSQFPDFTFFLDGVKVVMKPQQYMLQTTSSKGIEVNCLSVRQGSPQKTILGDSFMMGYYTIFDRENKRVGFANDYLVSVGPRIERPTSNVALIAGAAGGGAALLLIIAAVITTVTLRRRAIRRRDAIDTSDIGVTIQT